MGAQPALQEKPYDYLAASGLMMSAAAVALLAVYAGTGWHDGFADWDLHRLGRRLRRLAYLLLPAAALAGSALLAFYRKLLDRQQWGWGVLLAIPRAFIHFALLGLVCLLGIVFELAKVVLYWLFKRLRVMPGARRPAPEGGNADETLRRAFSKWLSLPVWFMFLPFVLMRVDMESDGDLPMPSMKGLKRRMLRWLPWMLAGIAIWTGAEGEDSGERVDPSLLSLAASYWLGDYVIVAFHVAPVLDPQPVELGVKC